MSAPVNPYGFAPMDRVKWFQVGLLAIAAVFFVIGLMPMLQGRRQAPVERLLGIAAPLVCLSAGFISYYRAGRPSAQNEDRQ